MALGDLKVGDAVPMKGFTAAWDGINLTYRAPPPKVHGKGATHCFLYLGIGSPDKPLNANEVLKALGWTPPSDPE